MAAPLHSFRQRISRLLRRAEREPERAAELVAQEVRLTLSGARLGAGDPSVVVEMLLHLLERLPSLLEALEEQRAALEVHLASVIARLSRVVQEHAMDRPTFQRVFELWASDDDGALEGLEPILSKGVAQGFGELARKLLQQRIDALPLPFPVARHQVEDAHRMVLRSERWRFETFLGRLLAQQGHGDYALLVAQGHYRATGQAPALVEALRSVGRSEDALALARRTLADPKAFGRAMLQRSMEDLLAEQTGESRAAESRKALEEDFLCRPSLEAYRALQRVVPTDQWERVSLRVLGHLQKHQKQPELLFRLYLDEGQVLEADGLATTQRLTADVLLDGARRISSEHPDEAGGWIFLAAHRRLAEGRASAYPLVVDHLLELRSLTAQHDQSAAFERAIASFRRRYARRTRFLELMGRSGL